MVLLVLVYKPEVVNGAGQDDMADWWSLGCILFEFLFGYPPFHGNTPAQVFAKILDREIDWPPIEEDDSSPEAKDLINRMLCSDPSQRLGKSDELKQHPFFNNIDWDTILDSEAPFIPQVVDPEDTDYFDPRHCDHFVAEDIISDPEFERRDVKPSTIPLAIPPHVLEHRQRDRRMSEPYVHEADFGSFVFKNLSVLEKANNEAIQRLRSEHLVSAPISPEREPGKLRQRSMPSPRVESPSSSLKSSSPGGNSGRPLGKDNRRRSTILLPSAITEDSSDSGSLDERKYDIKSKSAPQVSKHVRRNTMPSRMRSKSLNLLLQHLHRPGKEKTGESSH